MKQNILVSLFLVILFFVTPAWATTYYVTQSAQGNGSGTSYANSMSVANHNSGDDFSGDDVIYICDEITSMIVAPSSGTSGHPITYRGDYAGHTANIHTGTGNDCFHIYGKSYITVQSITMHDSDYGLQTYISGSTRTTNIIVKKVTIYNMDTKGIYIGYTDYVTVGGADGDGNDIKNCGKNTAGTDVVVTNSTNINVSYNELYADNTAYGVDGIAMVNSHETLIEYNTIYSHNHTTEGEDGIDVKYNNYNTIIRYNHIYDHQLQSGITVQMGSHDIYIYGNNVHDNFWPGVYIKHGNREIGGAYPTCQNMHDIDIWGNLLWKNSSGVAIDSSGDCSYTDINNVRIDNNVLAENGNIDSPQGAGVYIVIGSGHEVKNNIFYKNHGAVGGDTYEQTRVTVSGVSFDKNMYYYPSHAANYYWSGTKDLAAWNALAGVGTDIEQDQKMTDPDAVTPDYTLAVDSPCIGIGISLGGSYANILDPNNTDFSTIPPTVALLSQDTYGYNIGAYAYTTGETAAPVITSTADGLTNTCPNGADPITANFWLITDIPSYCKGGLKSTTCAEDYPDGYDDVGLTAYDNPGATNHGLLLSSACGAAYTVCAVCSDQSGSGGNETDWEEITRTVEAEQGINPPTGLTIYGDASGGVQVTIHSDTSGHAQVTPY